MIFIDTETCGLHGFVVLLQYAVDDGDIKLWDIWKEPIGETVELLEWFSEHDLCMFNASFDWFHIYKCWSTFSLLLNDFGPDFIPEDDIDLVAKYENKARDYKYCLKPKGIIDLMLHARKGPFQKLMRRKPIKIRRVPTVLAESVRNRLEQELKFDNILFAGRKDSSGPRWVIKDVKDGKGGINPSFKHIELNFQPSGKLKVLAKYALGVEDDFILKFTDVEVSKKLYPKEVEYAPYSDAFKSGSWVDVIEHHINHWAYHSLARKYASDDIVYTRDLYHYFNEPEINDTDSILACMVACVRWRGFKINIDKLKARYDEAIKNIEGIPTAPSAVKTWLLEVMNPIEAIVLNDGTGEDVLKAIAKWDTNIVAASRAKSIIDARHSGKELDIFKKLIHAGRFHAAFKVIGALSTRMSGGTEKPKGNKGGSINPQGIQNNPAIRECFPLAQDGYILCGGDFDSFEVSIAEAVYKDDNLRKDLLSKVPCHKCTEETRQNCKECKGTSLVRKSFHALFATELYPEFEYNDILKPENKKLYNNGKTAGFRLMYGGNWEGMVEPLDVEPEHAERAYNGFLKRYPGIQRARDEINELFCSMRQPGGLGTAVIWKEPAEYIDNGLGFRRYFTLENIISKKLFEIAQKPPQIWKHYKARIIRRDREQTACGAAQSALYAAAFNIQQSNLRAAANHEIQSKGAAITKEVQRAIWNIQPYGVHEWLVQPMNIHDEVMVSTHPSVVNELENTVKNKVESYKPIVPLISISWQNNMKDWSEK